MVDVVHVTCKVQRDLQANCQLPSPWSPYLFPIVLRRLGGNSNSRVRRVALARWAVTKVAPDGPLEAASAAIHP